MLDYMVMEAVAVRVRREDAKAQKDAEDEARRREWKKKTESLDKYR